MSKSDKRLHHFGFSTGDRIVTYFGQYNDELTFLRNSKELQTPPPYSRYHYVGLLDQWREELTNTINPSDEDSGRQLTLF